MNKYLRKFGVEIHGVGYLKKLKKQDFLQDAFAVQKELFGSRKVHTILDVGAHMGLTAKKYAQLFPEAKIYAVEPFVPSFETLSANVQDIPAVTPLNNAVTDKNETVTLHVNKKHDTNFLLASNQAGISADKLVETVSTQDVEGITIDRLAKEHGLSRIDILKMDIQGGELNALKGTTNLLPTISLIYTEVYFIQQYKEQPHFVDIYQYLRGFGFELQDLYDPYYNGKKLVWGDAIFTGPNFL